MRERPSRTDNPACRLPAARFVVSMCGVLMAMLTAGNAGAQTSDFGDFSSFSSASSVVVTTLKMGATTDKESAATTDSTATGDDITGSDDEDGVTLPASVQRGASGSMVVNVTNTTGSTAYLNVWVDWNNNGNITSAGSQIATNVTVASGTSNSNRTINFTVPSSATLGPVGVRVRLSSTSSPGTSGASGNGEVEDHLLTIVPETDYGDYPSFGAATQVANSNLKIGTNATDTEASNPTSGNADADDTTGVDDEDLTMPALTAGTSTTLAIPVTANTASLSGSTARIIVFADWNGDNDVADTNETLAVQSVSASGTYNFTLSPPSTTTAGIKHLRLRVSEGSSTPSFSGTSTLKGEVEDYAVVVGTHDFGDLSLFTSASSKVNSTLRIGASVDSELAETTSATATGDDNTGTDDEDGVTVPASVVLGSSSSLTVNVTNTSGSTTYLNAWIDFNGNGILTDSGEQIASNTTIGNNTSNSNKTVNFTVPATATPGTSGVRVRLTSVSSPGPDGVDGNGEVEDYVMTLACPTVTVSPTTPATATVGTAYSQTFSASGSTTTFTYSVTSGALPAGLSLNNSTGVVDGTPTSSTSASFTITATGANGCSGSRAYTITPACPTASLTPTTIPLAYTGSAYNQTLTASGGTAPYTYAISSGTLPAGLSLSAGGVLSGTPTTANGAGTSLTIRATDVYGCQVSRSYVLIVCPVITVSPATAANAVVGTGYSQTLSGGGGTGPYTFAVAAGALPTWASLNPSTGLISGTPSNTASATFTVRTTDANGCQGTQDYTISPDCPAITVNPATLSNGVAGLAYSQTVSGSGGTAPYTFAVITGALPAGLSLNTSTGAITGTPADGTTATFTIRATDNYGCTNTRSYTVTPVNTDFGDWNGAGAATASASTNRNVNIRLGATVDAEISATTNAAATADDLASTDDEDGVAIPASLVQGSSATIPVNVFNANTAGRYLQGWIDFNNDGSFNNTDITSGGERIYNDTVPASASSQTLNITFTVPANASVGLQRGARFRFTDNAATTPTSSGASGETEDYVVTIASPNSTTSLGLPIVQEWFVPQPEAQIREDYLVLAPKVNAITDSVITVTVPITGTKVVFDHWEDGYEVDLKNPVQPSTQIWGDGNDANGKPPGYANDPASFSTGSVITMRNNVTLPRNASVLLYDGRDRLGSTYGLVMTRAAWFTDPGPLLANSVEVRAVNDWGTTFVLPVGEDVIFPTPIAQSMFEHCSAYIMASQNGTTVQIDKDANGTMESTVTLNMGESYLINAGIKKGARITTSKPAQVIEFFGDINANYETRGANVPPLEKWSGDYYAPVGTAADGDKTYVFLYNPDASAITIDYTTQLSSGSFPIPARSTYQFLMPQNSAAHFASVNGKPFWGVGTVGAEPNQNNVHDWGYALVPKDFLSTVVAVGWGAGSDDGTQNGNPIWVTPTRNTTIYVDFNGDGNGPSTDSSGQKYDLALNTSALSVSRVYEPDKNQSGTRLYTLDGTLIIGAWGQDPAVAGPARPYLDLGNTLPNYPVPVMSKVSSIVLDNSPAGASTGDILEYTITLENKSLFDLSTVSIVDALPATQLSYTRYSTTRDGISVPDKGTTPFPLDESGLVIPLLKTQETTVIKFRATITGSGTITNVVSVAGVPGVAATDVINVQPGGSPSTPCTIDFTDNSGASVSVQPGDGIYLTVTDADRNTSPTAAETVTVNIVNTTTGELETITLTETGPNTGVFRNTTPLPTSTSSGQNPNDGTLYIQIGDNLTATHTDGTYGEECTDNATVAPPSLIKQLYLDTDGTDSDMTGDLDRVDPVVTGDTTTSQTSTLGPPVFSTIAAAATTTGSNTSITSGSTLSFSHTPGSGSNRLLLVSVGLGNTVADDLNAPGTVTGVTFGGTPMSFVDVQNSSDTVRTYIYALVNPSSSAANVVITIGSKTSSVSASATTFTGVNQSNPLGTAYSSESTGTTASLTVYSAPGQMIYSTAAFDEGAGVQQSIATSSGQTQLAIKSGFDYVSTASSYKSGGSSVTVSYTAGDSQEWAISAVAIKPAPTSGSSATWTQTPSFAETFSMPAGGNLGATGYVLVPSDSLSGTPDITAVLKTGGTTIATMTNPAATLISSSGSSAAYKVGNFTKNTSTGNQVIAHNLGTTPKAIIIWTAGNTSGSPTAHYHFGQGFSDGTTSYSISTAGQDNVSTTNTARRIAAKVLSLVQYDAASVVAEANLASWDSTNFTLNWTTNSSGTGYIVHYMIIGGPAVSAKVQNWTLPTATGNKAVTGTGFTPDLVLQMHGNDGLTGAAPSSSTRGAFGFGAMNSAGQQWAIAEISKDPNSVSDTWRVQRSDRSFLSMIYGTGAFASEASFVSMDANGFTQNFRTVSGNQGQVVTLALRGINNRLGSFTSTSATGNQVVTGLGFQPEALMIASTGMSVSTTATSQGRIHVGASDGTNQGSAWMEDEDNQEYSDVRALDKNDKIISRTTASDTISGQATLSSFNNDGFTLNWTTVPSSGWQNMYLALNSPAANSIYRLDWGTPLPSSVNLAAGQPLSLDIQNDGVADFAVLYDSSTYPSKINLPTNNVIHTDSVEVYDDAYPNGNATTAPNLGQKVYVRVTVGDPFGAYDITTVPLVIDAPGTASDVSATLTVANVVNSTTATKTFQYVWTAGSVEGPVTITATAKEGYEDTITSSKSTIVTLSGLDLGTPSFASFTNGSNGTDTTSFTTNQPVSVRVTDIDQDVSATVANTITATIISNSGDSELVTLTETDVNTGVFVFTLPSSDSIAGTSNNGTLYAPAGAVLTVSYVDPTDPLDTSNGTATIPAAAPAVSVTKVLLTPTDGQIIVGETARYLIRTTNTGNTTLNTVQVTDTFPAASLSYVSASVVPNTIASGSLTWTNVGPLSPGQSVDLLVNFAGLAAANPAVNTVNITTGGGPTASATAPVIVTRPAVTVTKTLVSPNPGPANKGDDIVFNLTVQNTGTTVLTTVPLEDTFSDASFEYIFATITPDAFGAGSLVWNDVTDSGSLEVGDTFTVTVTLRAKGKANPASNTATVTNAFDANNDPVPTATSSAGLQLLAATISGSVYEDKGTAGFGGGDAGLGNVTVTLYSDPNADGDPADGTVQAITTTDSTGYYEFLNLAAADYVVVQDNLPAYVNVADTGGANDNRIPVNVTTLTAYPNNNFLDIIPIPLDFGDWNGAGAATTTASTIMSTNIRLGEAVDDEESVTPDINATADGSDEDGVTMPATLVQTAVTTIPVNVFNLNTAGRYLQGWIDFNNDGTFTNADVTGGGERIYNAAVPASASMQTINVTFTVPANASIGSQRGVRFRFTDNATTTPTSSGATGETEDYVVAIDPPTLDFGDFNGFPSVSSTVAAGLKIGALSDVEGSQTINISATGDDITNSDDEDGVTMPGSIIAGATVTIPVVVTNTTANPAYLNAWIDYGNNGDLSSAGDQIASDMVIPSGTNAATVNVTFTVPVGASVGAGRGVRFRLTDIASPGFSGSNGVGEVEDYIVTIAPPTLDFGDFDLFPNASSIGTSTAIRIGATIDVEGQAATNATATGDDLNGTDDEDGVTIPAAITQGTSTSMSVVVTNTSGSSAYLNAWIDFNGNGILTDAGEQVATNTPIATGTSNSTRTINFTVPALVKIGTVGARVRLTSVSSPGPDGTDGSGEVEDVTTNITASMDFGDYSLFPAAGSTTSATLRIGSVIDAEGGLVTDSNASSDDSTGSDDEEGTSVPVSIAQGAAGSITATVTNTSGSSAYLNAWIDFNRNGVLTDAGEQIALNTTIPTGSTNSSRVINFNAPVTASLGTAGVRVRLTSTATPGPDGVDGNGETEDYITTISVPTTDFGDYSDFADAYSTASNDIRLGSSVDVEGSATKNATATGDDITTSDDEDSVVFPSMTAGQPGSVTVNVTNTSGAVTYLNAWIDFNNNGSLLDAGEQIASDIAIANGTSNQGQVVNFTVPANAVTAATSLGVRVRLTSTATPGPTGASGIGEVEDHTIVILAPLTDFGDFSGLPDVSNTASTNLRLGPSVDTEYSSTRNSSATGDDITGVDDEDGVTLPSMIAGAPATISTLVTNNTGSSCYLNAWIDYNNNGVLTDTGEQIANNIIIATGTSNATRTLNFTVPATAVTSTNIGVRVRISSDASPGSFGAGGVGEVEDHVVNIAPPTTDFGDFSGFGSAVSTANDNLRLGPTTDTEYVQTANANANGDDITGINDEDGVTLPSMTAGAPVTIPVVVTNTSGSTAYLNAWIDFNNNGVTSDSGEQIATSVPIATGTIDATQNLSFTVPATALTGVKLGVRFRLIKNNNAAATGTGIPPSTGSINIPTSADSWLNANTTTTNYGSSTTMRVDSSAGGAGNGRPVLKFDLSSIPAGSTITAATLSLNAVTVSDVSSRAIRLYPLNQSFVESQVTWNQQSSGVNWSTAGGSYGAELANTNVTTTGQYSWSGSSLIAQVQSWVDAPSGNLGLLLGDTDSGTVTKDFATKEDATPSRRPVLLVDYVGPTVESVGEIEDYTVVILAPTTDFGDFSGFSDASQGANPALRLGALLDTEFVSTRNATATGDDTAYSDDEDGVALPSMTAGQTVTIPVTITNTTGANGYLNAWIDYNNNGVLTDSGEQLASNILIVTGVTDGVTNLTVTVPPNAVTGTNIGLRFRLSAPSGLGPTGTNSLAGEVEDYVVNIAAPTTDLGDHSSLGTATSTVNANLMLGSASDAEYAATTNITATGDDSTGIDDEDGVVMPASLDPGTTITLPVTVLNKTGTNAYLHSWIDFNNDGVLNDALVSSGGERLEAARLIPSLNTGTILREYWTGISGSSVSNLTSNANYPNSPTSYDYRTSFTAPVDWADNMGQRMRGWIYPPVSGQYTFWVSGDDETQLFLSTDETPANATMIANVPVWTGSLEWTKYSSQKSVKITLVAGKPYYIEALMKEGGGGDNLAAAWELPGTSTGPVVIAGQYLAPWNSSAQVFKPTQQVNLTVPLTVSAGSNRAVRFRLTTSSASGPTGTSGIGEVEDYAVAINSPSNDFSDWSGAATASNGVDTNLFMGATVDAEYVVTANSAATGDDLNATDDEDGVSLPSFIAGGTFNTPVNVTNLTGAVAYLNAWIDFNNNGLFTDTGEQVIANFTVANGSNNVAINPPIAVPANAVTGTNVGVRFRLTASSSPGATGSGGGVGEVEDYVTSIAAPTTDQGDFSKFAAASSTASNALRMGSTVDTEYLATTNVSATGDDITGIDDEDGVSIPSMTAGAPATLPVTVTNNTGASGYLNVWIDFNNNGQLTDSGEQVATNVIIATGTSNSVRNISFTVPPTALTATSLGLRVRFTSVSSPGATGTAGTGEVEDYVVTVSSPPLDYGDWNGLADASSTVISDLRLGTLADTEYASTRNSVASGDDNTELDDEDGVTLPSMTAGAPATIPVIVTNTTGSPAYLNAWFDFNNNGSVADAGEQIATNTVIATGATNATVNLNLTIPANAVTGASLGLRFRLTNTASPGVTGNTGNGEVEDYTANIAVPVTDFGDWSNAADASNIASSDLRMGALADTEYVSTRNSTATGDDTTGSDDEDGVTIPSLMPGTNGSAAVVVTNNTGSIAYLNAWIDLNNNGSFADSGEQIATDVTVATGSNGTNLNLSFAVPATAVPGSRGTRFRLTSAQSPTPVGNGGLGEVEDHMAVVSCAPFTVSPASLPAGSVGTAYSQSVTADGINSPFTFNVSSGALPAGLNLDGSTGVISGTPTSYAPASFSITASDKYGCTSTRAYSLTPACPTISITPSTLVQGTVGTAYSRTLAASGGTAPYNSWTVTSGTLPAGLALNPTTGVISGTPTATASPATTVTVRVNDTYGCQGSQTISLQICPVVTLNPASLPNGTTGTAYSQTVSTSGGTTPYTFDLSSGSLLAGLTLDASTGVISGTPTTAATATFTVRATDANGCAGMRNYTITTTCPVLGISPASLPAAYFGGSYSQALTASNGTAPYTFAMQTGALPSGLSLSSNGVISGVPSATGNFVFTIRVTDTHACSTSFDYTLVVRSLSVGNLVFEDSNNNGVKDTGELGIANALVQLFATGDDNAIGGTGTAADTQTGPDVTTDALGGYLFTRIPPGKYYVKVTPPATLLVTSGTPAVADNDNDNNNDGAQPGGASTPLFSPVITLAGGTESVTDGDTDADTNLTIDFGLWASMAVGNFIFLDINGDGHRNEGESLGDIYVELYAEGSTPGVDAPVSVGSSGCSCKGRYYLDGLNPGNYFLHIPASQFATGMPLEGLLPMSSVVPGDDDVGQDLLFNSTPATNGASSAVFSLRAGQAPTGSAESGGEGTIDDAIDNLVDLTRDLGVVAPAGSGFASAERIRRHIVTGGYTAAILPGATTFATWDATGSLGGPVADPDEDGIPNLLEYALGTDPVNPLEAQRFALTQDSNGGLIAVLTLPVGTHDDIAIKLETLTDLTKAADSSAWNRLSMAFTTTFNDNNTLTRQYSNLQNLLAFKNLDTGFLRIRVELDANRDGIPEATVTSSIQGWSRQSFTTGDRTFSMPLMKPAVFTGRAHSVNGNEVVLPYILTLPEGSHYLEVVDGTLAGQRFAINPTSSSGNTLVLESSTNSYSGLVDARIIVRPHHALAGLLAPANFSTDDRVLFFDTAANNFSTLTNAGDAWQGAASLNMNERPFTPGEAALVQVRGLGTTLTFTGEVRANAFVTSLATGTQLIAPGWPVTRPVPVAGLNAASTPEQADRLRLWIGDNTAGNAGYNSWYLNSLATPPAWTLQSTDEPANQPADTPTALQQGFHGIFLLRTAPLNLRTTPPWQDANSPAQ
ncbi:MAG: GEVED domain-containing protein [Verrucomicrobiaceae bacterium]